MNPVSHVSPPIDISVPKMNRTTLTINPEQEDVSWSNSQSALALASNELIQLFIKTKNSRAMAAHLKDILKRVPSAKSTLGAGRKALPGILHEAPLPSKDGGGETSLVKVENKSAITLQCERTNPSIAFVFDIDGVLVRSKAPLPGARETLQMLQRYEVPFIFLTNGGGLTEADHVALVGQRLGLQLSEMQFVQSHTPFRAVAPDLRDAPVLVLGGVGHKIRDVARAYGFKNVLTSSDIFVAEPDIYPFAELTSSQYAAHGRDPRYIPRTADGRIKVNAVFVFSSPRDWGLDLQLIVDLLLSQDGILGTTSPKNGEPSLPNRGYQQDGQPGLYFCNPDLTWATKYPQPRMAQGSFAAALEGIWASRTGGAKLLNRFVCGKPTKETYEYAECALLDCHTALHPANFPDEEEVPKLRIVYMIGDNPASDIAGANAFSSPAGIEWKSILVESGVYESGTVPAHQPTAIAKGVKEAVELAFEMERRITPAGS
jgi:HAD superfamily hydrolase (TIGR01456 family)